MMIVPVRCSARTIGMTGEDLAIQVHDMRKSMIVGNGDYLRISLTDEQAELLMAELERRRKLVSLREAVVD